MGNSTSAPSFVTTWRPGALRRSMFQRRCWTGVATAACVLANIAGEAAAAETRCTADDHAQQATVTAVIDGDTLALADGRVVRLAGVEAPKRPLGLADSEPWPLEEASRRGAEQLAAPGAAVTPSPPSATGRIGTVRWRANVFVAAGGLWLQEDWLRRALAAFAGSPATRVRLRPSRGRIAGPAGASRSVDEPAIRRARGRRCFASSRNGLYELVEGRVVSVGHGSCMIFLDFGRDYRRDFTVMVSPPVAERMAAAGLPVDGLAGRRIRVRGVIEDSGGPAIRLNDPAEIEVLDDGDDVGAARGGWPRAGDWRRGVTRRWLAAGLAALVLAGCSARRRRRADRGRLRRRHRGTGRPARTRIDTEEHARIVAAYGGIYHDDQARAGAGADRQPHRGGLRPAGPVLSHHHPQRAGGQRLRAARRLPLRHARAAGARQRFLRGRRRAGPRDGARHRQPRRSSGRTRRATR